MNFLLRRLKLGRTSCKAISRLSRTGIRSFRSDRHVPEGNIVFRWGCTSDVVAGTIINQNRAISLVADKAGFRKLLNPEGLCPKTWFNLEELAGKYPYVVRPRVHHQGRRLYVCKEGYELRNAWDRVGRDGYISELIDKVSEYRVFVVQGRVVCVARKYPNAAGGVAWNVFQGGKFENVRWRDWPLKAVRQAIEVFKLSGLDFGGVDVMLDNAGTPYTLEINAAPSLTSPYRQDCFAKAFDYIVQNGKEHLPLVDKPGGYNKFAHPAVLAG